jgi:NADH:ubiquinone oxidoreductase subunit 6 (subunit J)
MAFLLKAIGGITALILLVITLLGSLITLGGFLLGAIKILIVVIFVAVLVMIVFSILRDRSHRKREFRDI